MMHLKGDKAKDWRCEEWDVYLHGSEGIQNIEKGRKLSRLQTHASVVLHGLVNRYIPDTAFQNFGDVPE